MKTNIVVQIPSKVADGETFEKVIVAYIDSKEVFVIHEDPDNEERSVLVTKLGASYQLDATALSAYQAWQKGLKDQAK